MTPVILPLFVAVAAVGVYLPSPADKNQWGLRVHGFSVRGPYIAEAIGQIRFTITLINFSNETRAHDPLQIAKRPESLKLRIIKPDGTDLRPLVGLRRFPSQDPVAPNKLRSGEFCSQVFTFKDFGHHLTLGPPGRYWVEATMRVDGHTIMSPLVMLEVVDVPKEAVLVNYLVPLEGRATARPSEEQSRPVVQQVQVRNRTYLVYFRRLAELPGKCEMTVTGAYGDWGPLTITYKTSPDAKPTKLVINSISGTPWTEEEEKLRQERLKAKEKEKPPAKP